MRDVNITIEDIQSQKPDTVAKVVKFEGQLDEGNVDEKSKLIYDLIEKNPSHLYLLFDFEGLEYMNSKSIGYFTDWYGKIHEAGGRIVISKARPNIMDILQIVGLTNFINCYTTNDDAKIALFKEE